MKPRILATHLRNLRNQLFSKVIRTNRENYKNPSNVAAWTCTGLKGAGIEESTCNCYTSLEVPCNSACTFASQVPEVCLFFILKSIFSSQWPVSDPHCLIINPLTWEDVWNRSRGRYMTKETLIIINKYFLFCFSTSQSNWFNQPIRLIRIITL